jgi:hypothetical protein
MIALRSKTTLLVAVWVMQPLQLVPGNLVCAAQLHRLRRSLQVSRTHRCHGRRDRAVAHEDASGTEGMEHDALLLPADHQHARDVGGGLK